MKRSIKISMMALAAMLTFGTTASAQKKKDFEESVAAGWTQGKGYKIAKDKIKNVIDLHVKARKYGYTIHEGILGSDYYYFYRVDEKELLDKEKDYLSMKVNSPEWAMDPSQLKTGGKGSFLFSFTYEYRWGSGYETCLLHCIERVNNVRWIGETNNGLLEGDCIGYFDHIIARYPKVYFFKGTFHNGMMTKGKLLSKNDKVEYEMELIPTANGLSWLKDNTAGASKWMYSLIDASGKTIIPRSYTAIKQDFTAGMALVTLDGIDIYVNKDGHFIRFADGIKEIPAEFFNRNKIIHGKIKSITIPSSVTKIGKEAFRVAYSSSYDDSGFESIIIPNSVTEIGERTFANSRSLKSVVLSNAMREIPKSAFSNCELLESVTLPQNLTTIRENAFYGCKALKNITLPKSLTVIEKSAFDKCAALESISLPESLIEIGDDAFSGCSISSIMFPSSLKKIGGYAFTGNRFTNITLPNTLESLGSYAFLYCPLTSITLPGSLTQIGNNVFCQCGPINSATVPAHLIDILKGQSIFTKCDGLKAVTVVDAKGKKTEDSNWYWKEKESPEAKYEQAKSEASKEENQNTIPLPFSKRDLSEKQGWSTGWPLIGSDLGLMLDRAGRGWKKSIGYDFGGKHPFVNVYELTDNQGFMFERAPSYYSPRYETYEDMMYALYFYKVKGLKRTRGLKKNAHW